MSESLDLETHYKRCLHILNSEPINTENQHGAHLLEQNNDITTCFFALLLLAHIIYISVVISCFTQIFSKNNIFLFQTFAGGGLHLPTPCLPYLCLPPPPPQPVGRLHAQVGSDDRKEERRPQRRIYFGWFRIQLWWEFWIWRKFFFFRSPGSEFWSFVGLRWVVSIGLQHCL